MNKTCPLCREPMSESTVVDDGGQDHDYVDYEGFRQTLIRVADIRRKWKPFKDSYGRTTVTLTGDNGQSHVLTLKDAEDFLAFEVATATRKLERQKEEATPEARLRRSLALQRSRELKERRAETERLQRQQQAAERRRAQEEKELADQAMSRRSRLSLTTESTYSLQELQRTLPGHTVEPGRRESYLGEREFFATFGMEKDEFYQLPKWKQQAAKKRHSLF